MITTESKTVDVNGLRLHYVERRPIHPGTDGRTTSLLLHGSSGNARVWDHFASRLARRMPTLALDLRGHGWSDHSVPPAYKAGDYLADLEQFLDRLDISSVILVAHSMSVFHSIRYTADHPERVARLVLIDIEATCRPEHRDLLNAAGRKPHPIFGSFEEAIAREARSAPFASPKELASFVESNLKIIEFTRTGLSLTYRFDRATLAQFDDYDEWSNLRRIRCPALIVYGEKSPLIRPEVVRAMEREMTGAELAEIPRAGHLPMLDNPEDFEKALLAFCAREAG